MSSQRFLIVLSAVALTAVAPVYAQTLSEFDAGKARLNMMLDANGDGDVSTDEIIKGNTAVFDLNGDGIIDAFERGEAEALLGD